MQGGEIFGEPQRVPLGNDVEGHSEADALRPFGNNCTQHQTIGHHLVSLVLEVVFGEPIGVVAKSLGC